MSVKGEEEFVMLNLCIVVIFLLKAKWLCCRMISLINLCVYAFLEVRNFPFGSELGACAYEALYLHLLIVSMLEWIPVWEWRCIALDHVKICVFSRGCPRCTGTVLSIPASSLWKFRSMCFYISFASWVCMCLTFILFTVWINYFVSPAFVLSQLGYSPETYWSHRD